MKILLGTPLKVIKTHQRSGPGFRKPGVAVGRIDMREDTLEALRREKLVAIVRGLTGAAMQDLAKAFAAGGIRFMEITFRQNAPETWAETARAIAEIRGRGPEGMHVGAGTVLTLEQLALARKAGAEYIISPNADRRIIEATREAGLVSLPGALTPTEIAAAHEWGADMVKVFPADCLGPAYIRAVRAPLAHIPLMAVGGINERNAAEYIAAGAAGLGVGGNLVNSEWIFTGRFDRIEALAHSFVQAVRG